MGGGDDAPDSPDYSELINYLKDSSNSSKQTSDDMMAWAKQAYSENKQVGDQVIDFALGQMDKQAAWADADRKRYEDIYQPLEDQYAARAQDYSTPERQEYEAGRAEADVAAQFAQARQTAQDNLEQYGVDPSQTRQGALDLQTRVAEAAAQAGAGNQARFRTEQYGDQLMSNAINTGKGYSQQILGESGAAGQSGNQATNTGLATTASGSSTQGSPLQWAGLGNQATGQWGQMLNAGFQNQLGSWNANQQSSSGWGQILGLGASMAGKAAGFWQEGGAIPDDPNAADARFVDPSMSPSGGAIQDDIPAQTDGGAPARINAGEFIMPKDVTSWLGEKGMQQLVLKARKEMQGANGERPAQPETGPPPGQAAIPPRGIGAIPELENAP